MKPGTTVIPPASTTSTPGPARFEISSSLPTAEKRPCWTANASAVSMVSAPSAYFEVYTRAFRTMRSGRAEPPGEQPAAVVSPAAAAAPLNLRNSARVRAGMAVSSWWSGMEVGWSNGAAATVSRYPVSRCPVRRCPVSRYRVGG